LDAVLLFAAAGWLAQTHFLHWRRIAALVGGVAAILAASAAPLSLSVKIPFVTATLLLFTVGVWFRLSQQERSLIVMLGRSSGRYTERSILSGITNS